MTSESFDEIKKQHWVLYNRLLHALAQHRSRFHIDDNSSDVAREMLEKELHDRNQ